MEATMSIWSDTSPPGIQRAYGAREQQMIQTIWSNTCPSGRTYRDHLSAAKLSEDDGHPNMPTFHQMVINLGGGPVRTHSSLAVLLEACDVGFSIDDSLEPDTVVVGAEKNVLRVTGLYA